MASVFFVNKAIEEYQYAVRKLNDMDFLPEETVQIVAAQLLVAARLNELQDEFERHWNVDGGRR